ncbi:vesicle transport through interaction with t-SNAREs 1b isoform X1 [Lasioglossum baleicum]|uniref:vesicle transport through interaction with t-SNAREs 1b isoform X1 n=1 Tax=Lasioglossum baleicum TaxID=434251 RepID=UPI003FCD9F4D
MSNIRRSVIMENNKQRVKESFYLMDSDADGYLDYHEMKAALKALGFTVKKSYVLTIMRMYDKHGCNKICFDDFNYVVLEKLSKRSPLDEIKYAFKSFINDSLHDKITLEDLQRLNKQLECNLTIEEMKLMMKEFDLDQDGSINESEFIEIMMNFGI